MTTQSETYLVFIRNVATSEEFTAPFAAHANSHENVLARARHEYSEPRFQVHTAYTVSELQNTIENLNRWGVLPSKVQHKSIQKNTQDHIRVNTHMPDGASAKKPFQAAQNGKNPLQELIKEMKNNETPTPQAETPVAQAKPAPTTGVSVIEQLKAFRLAQQTQASS